MNKLSLLKLTICSITFVLLLSCKTTSTSLNTYRTECMGVELDGSQTLKAWGTGRYRKDAVEQAMKNAVYEVLFKGISFGSRECQTRPLVPEVNAGEKYESYFNTFFRDNGAYRQYISLQDERIPRSFIRKAYSRNKDQSTYSVLVRVMRNELKQQLINDGILKP